MRISDWSSDVCSSDLRARARSGRGLRGDSASRRRRARRREWPARRNRRRSSRRACRQAWPVGRRAEKGRSEEHTSELQSLMRISYAVFCLKKKKTNKKKKTTYTNK